MALKGTKLAWRAWKQHSSTQVCFQPEHWLTWGHLDAKTLRVPHGLLLLNVKLDQRVREEKLDGEKQTKLVFSVALTGYVTQRRKWEHTKKNIHPVHVLQVHLVLCFFYFLGCQHVLGHTKRKGRWYKASFVVMCSLKFWPDRGDPKKKITMVTFIERVTSVQILGKILHNFSKWKKKNSGAYQH